MSVPRRGIGGADATVMTNPAEIDRQEDEAPAQAPDDRRKSAGNIYTNVRRRSVERGEDSMK